MIAARIRIPTDKGPAALNEALEGLVRLNVAELCDEPRPPIYESGVRYKPEPVGRENWDAAAIVFPRGTGDCEDLAAIRAAQLRNSGVDPGARAVVRRSGPRLWHAIVARSDGTTEDPSRKLGMDSRGGRHMRNLQGVAPPAPASNLARRDATLTTQPVNVEWAIKRVPEGGWRAVIRVPTMSVRAALAGDQAATAIQAEGVGIDRARALRAATATVRTIASSPVMQALIPPQARGALRIMGRLARIATSKRSRRFFGRIFGRIRSGGLRRFARALFR